MTNKAEFIQQIEQFEQHYQYDTTYMRELLQSSESAYAKFNQTLPLCSHREHLDKNSFWTVKLVSMQLEDCGACLQLNIQMAKEDGVATSLIRDILEGGKSLPQPLQDVYHFTQAVALNLSPDSDLSARIEQHFNKGQRLELGLAVATTKLFPVIKRSMGYARQCQLDQLIY